MFRFCGLEAVIAISAGLASACGGGDDGVEPEDAMDGLFDAAVCDPLSGAPCADEFRCAWRYLPEGGGEVRCTANGDAAEVEACFFGAGGFGADNCMAQLLAWIARALESVG